VIVRVDHRHRVTMRASIDTAMPAESVWERMRDFERFTALDPIHERIRVLDGAPRKGARIVIEHRFAFFSIDRVGRILRWDDGAGYTICDLSSRGVNRGFPHTLDYRVEPTATGSRWSITVRGKWTARFIPRFAARLWMRWVLHHITGAVRRDLLRAAVVHNAAMRRSTSA
jgi:hypothetical protein